MNIEKKSSPVVSEEGPKKRASEASYSIGEDSQDALTESQIIAYAHWMQDHLVNRDDAYVSYYIDAEDRKLKSKKFYDLSLGKLASHARGFKSIVTYSMALNNTCKWVAWDCDNHAKLGSTEEQNIKYTKELQKRLAEMGLNVLREGSDGRGGFHIWCIFSSPIKTLTARKIALWAVEELCPWKDFLEKQPECFPNWDKIGEDQYGYGLRMPGKHHRRDLYSEIYVPFKILGWRESVDYILNFKLNDPLNIPDEIYDYDVQERSPQLTPEQQEELDLLSKKYEDPLATMYNESITWGDLMEKYDWIFVGHYFKDGRQCSKWRHPLATQDHSATTGYCGDNLFLFSDNCHPLIKGKAYSKHQFYVYMEFGGDFEAANQFLLEKGLNDE